MPRKKPAPAAAAPNVQNRYDAAGNGRRMKAWNPPNSGPNTAIQGIENIRKRSSDTVRNDWAGSAGIQHWTTNLIGTGIVPRPKRIQAKKKKQAVIDLWDDWCKVCDADGIINFYGMQTLATRAWLERGEVFARIRPRRSDSGFDVPMQVQLLEADFVPMLDADTWPGLAAGNRIRSGVELDNRGQRVAYWVYKEHPGDNTGRLGNATADKLVRVTKSQMLHIFEPKRPNQLRGVPDFAAILAHLRNVMDYSDNVLERQKIANLFVGWIKKQGVQFPGDTTDPLTGQAIQQTSSGASIGLRPGTLLDLNMGEDMGFANPPEPGTMYHEYMRTSHLGTAAGQGLPYELLTGDIREVSDRTLRIIINEFRRFAEQRQWQIIIPMFCQPVRDAWTDAAVLAGKVSTLDAPDVKAVEWAPQGWAYIHPVQDVQAKQAEVDAGFRSRSSVIAEKGDDPEVVDQERADDQKRAKDLGIEEVAKPGDPAKPAEKKPAKQQQQPTNDGRMLRLQSEHIEAQTEALRAQSRTAGEPTEVVNLVSAFTQMMNQQSQQLAATMQAFTQIAQSLVDRPLVTNVAAPAVKVENTVEPTPVTVNVENTVEPTPVKVENNLPAPIVNVTNEVSVDLPDRQTTSMIERDSKGSIVSVTQVEKTIQ